MRADQPVWAEAWPIWRVSIGPYLNRVVSRLAGLNASGCTGDAEEAVCGDVLACDIAQELELLLPYVAARTDEIEQVLELGYLEVLRPREELDLDVYEEGLELIGNLLDREPLAGLC